MDWDKYLKRYVWDDDKTPYFISVAKLNRRQAEYEIKAFAILCGFLFALLCIFSLSPDTPMGRSVGASFYSMTMVFGCILLTASRSYYVAVYCALAPVWVVGFILLYGFPPKLAAVDHIVVSLFLAVWSAYSYRLTRVAKRYPYMPDAVEPEKPRRRGPYS